MKFNIPQEVISAIDKLQDSHFKTYLVGGCVRDLLLTASGESAAEPKDWDIATDAKPEEIQKIFPDSVYENNFGTVGVKTRATDPKLKILEITTFRLEGKYTDKRHPDEIKFARTIEEDLARRDFTVNAIALKKTVGEEKNITDWEVIDPFDGRIDLKNKIIKAVGDPEARFNEDALRLMRAVRFAVQLNSSSSKETGKSWQIEMETRRAIEKNSKNLEVIATERIRDDLVKIIMCRQSLKGILMLDDLNLLQ
jgi:tRNA nucleotidyltransferase/poly(A) polymerase